MVEVLAVGEAVAGEAAQARNQLEALIKSVNKSSFDIGELAHKIKNSGDYGEHTTFADYKKTLNIKARKLQYLGGIFEVMEAVGITREKFEPLGISKLREITSLKPTDVWTHPETGQQTPMSEFIIGFVEKGAELSLDEIQGHVRVLKNLVGENDIVFRKLAFRRYVADTTWDKAIEAARNHIGSTHKDDEGISQDASDSACAEILAIEYLNDPANNILPDNFEEEFTVEES